MRGHKIHPAKYIQDRFWIPDDYILGPEGLLIPRYDDFGHAEGYEVKAGPMRLYDPQPQILHFALVINRFSEYLYSTIKKSGKTTLGAAIAKWVAETAGAFAEVYMIANDLDQARSRAYKDIEQSLRLDPSWDGDHKRTVMPDGRTEWRHIQREIIYEPTNSTIRAVPIDYKGESGGGQNATFWTELWGFDSDAAIRLFGEMRPISTRGWSFRWMDTYAGFLDTPGVLYDMYKIGTMPEKGAKRLTCHEFVDEHGVGLWPQRWIHECDCSLPRGSMGQALRYGDGGSACQCDHVGKGLPIYVNETAKMFTYWDEDDEARRMPWHTTEYFEQQKAAEPDESSYRRFHQNKWITKTEAFLPIEWYDACAESHCFEAKLVNGTWVVPEDCMEVSASATLDSSIPCVMSVDAAVNDDSIAIALVSRHPDPTREETTVIIRKVRIMYPPLGGSFDYGADDGLKAVVRDWCGRWNVVCVTYDAYQLHDVMTEMNRDGVAWCVAFSQGSDRMIADKGLHHAIRNRELVYAKADRMDSDFEELRKHIQQADRQVGAKEETKFRIVKRSKESKIDGAVALSMARHKCLKLDLGGS